MLPSSFLVAIGGQAGTGKSTLAHLLRKHIPILNNAAIVEDDHARRLLLGRSLAQEMQPDDYREDVSARTRLMLNTQIEKLLKDDHRPVIDCSGFYTAKGQEEIESLAQQCAVPFIGLWLTAPKEILVERLKNRTEERKTLSVLSLEKGHASDADPAILDKFSTIPIPLSSAWNHLSTDQPLSDLLKQITQHF